MPDESGPIYFDTVTLSNFALAERLDLITRRYGPRARLTAEVLDELSEGIAAGYGALVAIESAVENGQLALAQPLSGGERQAYRRLLRVLAPGEAACLACALSRGGIVATDDRAARAVSAERAVRVTGTIGILKACVRDGMMSAQEADGVLLRMVAAGYHSPVLRISSLL